MEDYVTCQDCVELLNEFIDSNLDPETLSRLEEHLAACPPCVHFLKTYRSCSQIGVALRDREADVPSEMASRIKAFLRTELNRQDRHS